MMVHFASQNTQPGSADGSSGFERVWRLGDRETPGAYLYGPGRFPNYASLTTANVTLGGGAGSTIVAPCFGNNDSLEWKLRYGDAEAVRFTAASALASYAYLTSDAISTTEAVRRLKLLRKARADLVPVAVLAAVSEAQQVGTPEGVNPKPVAQTKKGEGQ